MYDPAPVFSSPRERRLWLWTLAAIAAIYATLGLSSVLAGVLYNQGVSAVLFLLCMVLIGVVILMQGAEWRPRGREIGVGIGIVVVYGFLFFRMAIPERSHLIEYSVVAVLIYEALSERASQGRRVPLPAVLAIAGTALVGVLDECLQLLIPHRMFDPVDMLFNALAAGSAVLAVATLRWARRWRRSKRSA